jgi:hypothetical protein
MNRDIVRAAVIVAVLVVLGFAVVLINQTAQLVGLVTSLNATAGAVALWGLLIVYGTCVAVPVWLLLRLPRAIRGPMSEEDPNFRNYLDTLKQRLSKNRHVAGPIQSRADVEAAICKLDEIADEQILGAAKTVFLTTAISQNGNLDAIVTLGAQSRLVLQVARTYNQRPSARELTQLYANVAGTAFVAGELNDADLAARLQPIMAALPGSIVTSLTGLGPMMSVVLNSIMSGAANAFLTLRVGAIAKQYSGCVVTPDRSAVRRAAVVYASRLVGAVVLSGSKQVTNAALSGAGKGFKSAATGVGSGIAALGTSVRANTLDRFARDDAAPQEPEGAISAE